MKSKNFNIVLLSQTLDDELIKKSKLIKTDKFTMGAITSKGTNPNKEENHDYSALITHPKSKDLAMMIIADGKDEETNSGLAAHILVENLCMWFKSLSKTYINTPMVLESMLLGRLRHLNSDLYRYYSPSGTSFALAIKGKKETFIANIGNCRVYTINDNAITLQTTDNLAWYDYNEQNLITPDEVKYLQGKDYVSRTIGSKPNDKRHFEPFISIVPNDEYNSLLLTTHGITDVLDSDEMLYYVNEDNIDNTLDNIINKAVFSNPKELPDDLLERFKQLHIENMLIENTIPGDSNATAIVYKKTR